MLFRSLSPNITGLDHPVVFKATTRQGRIYTMRIGNTLTNDTFDRYVQVSATWKAPPESKADAKDAAPEPDLSPGNALTKGVAKTNTVDTAKALNDRLAAWTFILKSYRAEPFLIKRVDLIKKNRAAQESRKIRPGGQGGENAREKMTDTRPEDGNRTSDAR